MSDLKLFRVTDGKATEIAGSSVALERSLQRLIEKNMDEMFGVRFLATEYSTGARHGGRIDSLGLDENGSPVIFEYKRASNENVINQGLFYLDWLLDHKAEFRLLVMEQIDPAQAANIDWSSPRLVCVASGFTKYDQHAVEQINRAIDLVSYRDFGGDLFSLELVHTSKNIGNAASDAGGAATPDRRGPATNRSVTDLLSQADASLQDLYVQLDAFLTALGDDTTRKTNANYFAYRRLKNFACVEVHPQTRNLLVYLKVDPDTVELVDGFSRDVRNIGHFGTGNLELRLRDSDDLARAQPLLEMSYANS